MKKRKIGEIVTITKGRKAQIVVDEKLKDAVRYIQIEDLRTDNKLQYTTDTNGVFVSEDDLCIAWDGANAGTVGYGLSGLIGSTIARLHIADTCMQTQYVGRFLQSKFNILNGKTTGTTIPHVERRRLEELELPCVPLAEQRRIAAILDKADAIRRKRQQSLELAGSLLKSTYNKICGHQNKEYANWHNVTIAELAETMLTGPFGSALRHSEFVSEGIAVLGIDNAVNNSFEWGERRFISEEKYAQMQRYTVIPDDVIVTIMGTTGRSAVVPHDIPKAISTKHLATIRLDKSKALPNYISCSFFMNHDVLAQVQRAGKGAVMPGLNLGIIKSLSLKLPPYENQKQFSKIVNQIEIQKNHLRVSQDKADQTFKSLQKSFFG